MHFGSFFKRAVLLTALVSSTNSVIAEEEQSIWNLSKENADRVDQANATISGHINSASEYIDSFFVDDRFNEEFRGSRLRVRLGLTFDELGNFDLKPRLQFNLALPKTKRKLQLFVDSITDDGDLTNSNNSLLDDANEAVSLGMRYFLVDSPKYSFNLSAGLRFSSGLNPLIRARLHRRWVYGQWAFQPTQFAFWSLDEGFGERSRFDIDYRFLNTQLMRNRSELTYSEESVKNDSGLVFENTSSWVFVNKEKRGLRLQHWFRALARPSTVIHEHFSSVLYRQAFHKKILFFELEPGVRFFRERDYDTVYEFTFRIEANFSKESFEF